MVYNNNFCLAWPVFMCIMTMPFVSSNLVTSTYLQFSNQTEVPLNEATNFVTLKSVDLVRLSSKRFTLCGSIFIRYFRSSQSFYTVRHSAQDKLWLSLAIENQEIKEERYTPVLYRFGSASVSNTGARLLLRPHSWSHACTTVDQDSGHFFVVINGILTHNITITNMEFFDNFPKLFQNNLVLGVKQVKFSGMATMNEQSEASVKNVDIMSVPMSLTQMVHATSSGRWREGDIVSWSKATWAVSGIIKEIETKKNSKESHFRHLFRMADGFTSCDDCLNLCPRMYAGGRLPITRDVADAEDLAGLFYPLDRFFWATYRYQEDGNFSDHFTGSPLAPDLWMAGEPNGWRTEPCTLWWATSPQGKLFDYSCHYHTPGGCLCQFDDIPILRIRGLCTGSKIDTHFTLQNVKQSVVFLGLTGTEIKFDPTSTNPKWTLNVNIQNTTGFTTDEEMSFILGRHTWSIEGDSVKCSNGEPYSRQLKMSGCKTTGEFTCDDGQCITMEQRCDQVSNCKDQSDEVGCKLLVLNKNYRKKVPPFTTSPTNYTIIPVNLKVSIDLLNVVKIEETNNKIDLQFQITLEWRENARMVYHNLKHDTSLNTLSDEDISKLWLPQVIYDNTDQKDTTRLGMGWEWNTHVNVIREGEFIRSGLDMVDETEIYEGRENSISMQQVYTRQFQCKYDLHHYPFDMQV